MYNRYKIENGKREKGIKQLKYINYRKFALFKVNISDRSLLTYVSHWNRNKCFTSYIKNKCDLKILNSSEVPMKLLDLWAVLVFICVLLFLSTLGFFVECA